MATLRQRWLAWFMRNAMGPYERRVAVHKRRLFADLAPGTIAEIGCGIGPNRVYLPDGSRWIGLDPNPLMRPSACASAEALPLEDGSVDAVISTLVLCSVWDPARTLAEIHRVLRPGGRLYFLEHVAARHGTWMRIAQQAARPFCAVCADGCDPLRDTGSAIRRAGFAEIGQSEFRLGFPHIAGVARKR
jgi:SAM-dependent methyltransferase